MSDPAGLAPAGVVVHHARMHGARLPLALVLVLGCGPRVRPQPQDETTTSDATAGTDATGQGTTPTTGTSSVVTTGLDSSGSDTTGNPFIADPDFGGCGGGRSLYECSLWDQDCCPGEKCMPWANDGSNSWNATRCSEVADNPGQVGDECTVEGSGVSGIDDCDVGSMCYYVDPETNVGTCVAFCEGSQAAPMCEPGFLCSIANNGVLILCRRECDPLLQDCQGSAACLPAAGAEGFVCIVDASGESGAPGDPCEYLNSCDPGLLCADAQFVPGCQASGGCTEFCDLNDPNKDDACSKKGEGVTCEAYYEMDPPPGLENIGVCILPQT